MEARGIRRNPGRPRRQGRQDQSREPRCMPQAFFGSFGVPVASDLSTYLSDHKEQKEITYERF